MAKVKREPDTIWKLVNARCQQLADSVAAARVPFLTALTWSFVWAWALYSVDLGYLGTYRIRYANFYSQSMAMQPSEEFKNICAKVLEDLQSAPQGKLGEDHIQRCKELVKQRFEWSDRAFLEGTQLTFPGGFGKLHVSDLG